MDAHGEIPPGHHIHHRDGDPLNNAPDNLECIAPAEHVRLHYDDERRQRAREHIARIAPLAAEWHRSDDGRKWHREHPPVVVVVERECEQCGKRYEAADRGVNRFCSNACKSAWRRASGVDDEDRVCVECGEGFRTNRYSKTVTCSPACAGRRSGRARSRLQPDG